MKTHISLLFIMLALSGCMATPRIDIPEKLYFNYVPPNPPQPMSYSDLLCCVDCKA